MLHISLKTVKINQHLCIIQIYIILGNIVHALVIFVKLDPFFYKVLSNYCILL